MKKLFPICLFLFVAIYFVSFSGFTQNEDFSPSHQDENHYAYEEDLLEVMFIESSRVRLRNGQLTDLISDATAGLSDLLSQIEWHQWFRFCSVDESEIDQWSVNGERNTGKPVYNLNNIYRLRIPKGYDAWELCRQLEALPGIFLAIPVPKPVPAPSSAPPPGSFQSQQGYLNSAASTPTGVDAIWAWTQTGGTGSGVTICDLEYSWNYSHADVTKALNSQINPNPVADPFNDDNHGTAVIGQLVSDNNGWGTTGISYGSGLKTCGTYYWEFGSYGWNPAGAIGYAISSLSAGDIILLEQQWEYTPGSADYIPLEWYASYNPNPQYNNSVYAAIVNAVSNGIHVVQAGGNGNVNTDNLTWYGNSGAIIVGAGGAYSGGTWTEGDLQRLSFSSYGQRFDLQGWGEDVVTTGYGNLYSVEGKNYWYTNSFSGTSSASPIVAGAVACIQGYYLANISTTPFSPSAMRSHLITYGTAQIIPPSGHIGPRPDIKNAIQNLPQLPDEYDFGDAPDMPYPTLLASSGARHKLDGITYLGISVDPENDGQPNATATGDDNDGNNDDDGVVFTSLLIPGQTATVQVTASVAGILNAWIDFNQLSVWSDPGEFIFQNVALNAGVNNLSFFVPFNAIAGNTFARFRFSSTGGLLFYGAAPDGEVEDYMVYIGDDIPPDGYDWGDAPDPTYPTLAVNNGACHQFLNGFFLGSSIDTEPDGQPDPQALGDDNNGIDDEDGVVFSLPIIPGNSANITVTASASGILNAWIDLNFNGSWGDPGEHIFVDLPIAMGPNPLAFPVTMNVPIGNTFARFRFSSVAGLSYTGMASDGEVEDYMVYIGDDIPPEGYDWGDAPDGPYPTLAINNGANHMIMPGFYLGSSVDPEPDGQPDPNATGDDNDGNNDDDGVIFTSQIIAGQMATVDVIASSPGILNAWIDFDNNGTWMDPGEHIFIDVSLVTGINNLTYMVPSTGFAGFSFARFRFSSTAGLTFSGPAPDGEVEDYEVFIGDDTPPEEFDWGDAPDGPYPTLAINNGAHHLIVPGVYLGNSVDPEPDGQPNSNATGDDNDGNNDDDGVIFTSQIIPGQIATVDVIASAPGILNAWIDFDFNGSWAEPFDHFFIDFPLNPGLNNLTFTVPNLGIVGHTFARFRFSNMPGLPWFGFAPDGEVEDYMVYIGTPAGDIQMDPDPMMAFVQNEISMAIVPSPTGGLPTVLLAAYNDQPYPGGPGLGVSYSHDAGTTWLPQQLQYPKNPLGISYADAFDPAATADGLGNLFVAHISTDHDWTNGAESGLYVHKSIDGGMTWQAPVQIAYDAKPSGSPDPNYRFNDRCQITCDLNTGSPFYNHLYAVWIKDRGWNMSLPYSDVYFSKSTDGGLTWSPSVTLNQPIHSMGNMPNPAVAPDGSIYVIWIDYNVLTGGLGTIFMNVSNDGGLTWLPSDMFVTAVNLPPLNLNGGTDVLAKGAAVIETSPFNPLELYIVYAEQVIAPPDEADIFFIKSLDGGLSWTIPLRVNDDITLNDQVMPWMDVKPNGIIDIVWYDRRNDPADMLWDVFMATSLNGGNSFLPNQQMNAVPAPSPQTPTGIWMGEYLGLVVDNTHAYIGFASAAWDIQGDVFFAKVENPTFDMDFGDAPDPTYPTLLANDGARHILDGITYLGASVDPEPDGQPDANATGDDNDGNNDDDGILFNWPLLVGSPATINVTVNGTGLLNGWIDFDGDGTWAQPNEHIFVDLGFSTGTYTLSFIVPPNAVPGMSFARFRFSTQPGLSYTGLAPDGEVEDYEVLVESDPDIKWQQLPGTNISGLHAHDYINALGNHESIVLADDWLCQGGVVTDIHWWGNYETDSQGNEKRGLGISHFHLSIHNDDPTGNCLPANPEIWGVNVPLSSIVEQPTGLFNNEGCQIYLYEYILPVPFDQIQGNRYWLDITAFSIDPSGNNLAVWRWQEAHRVMFPILCPAAGKTDPAPGTWGPILWGPPQYLASDMAFAITSGEPPEPPMDFGDAPDPTYPTLLASDGARHILDGITYLGLNVDPELDGQPDPNALGDDNDGNDDEDGVVFNWPVLVGSPASISVTASSFGMLNAWFDFDGDGTWSQPNEHVFIDLALNAGTHILTCIVPVNAVPGITFARFRFSTQPGLSYTGLAPDGEVEDYEVMIEANPDLKWQQLPGTNISGLHAHDYINGLGNHEYIVLADDWQCQGGAVAGIRWWGNYELDYLGVEKRGAGINSFRLSIHSDDPTGSCLPIDPPIWSMDVPFLSIPELPTGQVNNENCMIYEYTHILSVPFNQIAGTRYWLAITAFSVDPNNNPDWRWQEAHRVMFPILCPSAGKQSPVPDTWGHNIWGPPNYPVSEMAFALVPGELMTDFGDAPDPTYPTLLANDGARHILDGITYLGTSVDPEPDGQPDANATGDDNDGNNDDDGVVLSPFTPVWTPGGSVWLDITASGNGYLSAWVDYNANGSWADPGEQILTDQLMTPGPNSFILTIPNYAEIGITFARYRFSSVPGLSFTGLAPDGEVEDYQIMMEGDVDVDIKVFLEGAYYGSVMNTDLNDANLLPLTQPYGSDPAAKWYYTGTESVAVIPDPDITDWVLVEFRDAPDASQATGSTRVAQMAAFLKKDGSVVGLDGISPMKVYGVFQYQPYVIVWHRNHLGVLSANPLVKSGVNHYTYDFTTGAGQAYNGSLGHKDIGGGVYGMFSADGKPDGLIDSQDKSVWTSAAGNAGYDPADYNLDTQVDNKDKNEQWVPNDGEGTQVPN